MAKKKKSSKSNSHSRPKPRQKSLPGMEDRAVAEIEALAEQIDALKKKRASAREQQKELEGEMLVLMNRRHKTEYHHDEVHVWTQETSKKVVVKMGRLELQDQPSEQEETAEEVPEVPETDVPDLDETENEEIPGTTGT